MNRKKIENVYTIVKPLLFISKAFGLYPNVINNEFVYKPDIWALIWAFILSIGCTSFITFSIIEQDFYIEDKSILIIDIISLVISVLNSVVTAVVAIFKQKQVN